MDAASAPGQQDAGDDVLVRLRALDACTVSDALDACRLAGVAPGLHSVTGPHRICGRAVTVELVEGTGKGPHHLGTAAVDASGPGDVIVVAHAGRTNMAGWGGVLSAGARHRSVNGVVVDGAVRDVDQAAEVGLPIFAAARTPVSARGRVVERSWNAEVTIAGIRVEPGDYVVADSSGVAFVPSTRIEDVLDAAARIAAKEAAMLQRVAEALPMVEVMGADYETLLDTMAPRAVR